MPDQMIRAIDPQRGLRLVVCQTSALSQEAISRHKLHGPLARLLSQNLTAVLLLASAFKDEDRLSLQVSGDGLVKHLFSEADGQGRVRGYVRLEEEQRRAIGPKTSQGKLIGQRGYINVLRETDGEFYRGLCELSRGVLAADIENYLQSSEQLPSCLLIEGIGEPMHAGGLLLQILPGGDEQALRTLRGQLLPGDLTELLQKNNLSAEEIAKALVPGFGTDFIVLDDPSDLSFYCPCSRERAARALHSLGAIALDELIAQDQKADIHCDFCGNDYHFDLEALIRIHATLLPTGSAE